MSRLPLRERILNAWAAGFAGWWIAERFGCSRHTVLQYVSAARRNGDLRAVLIDHKDRAGRSRPKYRPLGVNWQHDTKPDDFPDLPGVYEPIEVAERRRAPVVEDVA